MEGKGKQWEEQDVLVSSTGAWAGGKGSRNTGMGRVWDHIQVPLFLLVHQTDSQKLATLWSIPPTQALLSTHLIKQKERKVGGRGAGSEGTGTWPGRLWWFSLS